jgi:hypothetical protein
VDRYDEDLPPAEAAREKRRDRDAEARARAGMKTGLAKQFKQVLDSQAKRARELDPKAGVDPDERDEPDGGRGDRRGARPGARPKP